MRNKCSFFYRIIFLALFISSSVGATQCTNSIKAYPELKDWSEKLSNFQFPYEMKLIEKSVFLVMGATLAAENVYEKWLKEKKRIATQESGYDGYIETSVIENNNDWNKLWGNYLSDSEQKLLDQCQNANCKIKFNPNEIATLAKTPRLSNKDPIFKKIVLERLEQLKQNNKISFYDFEPAIKQPFEYSLPQPFASFTDFKSTNTVRSIGFDIFNSEPGKHKPVTTLYERRCSKSSNNSLNKKSCIDISAYHNHYFDFWARKYIFYPWCGQTLVLVLEIIDVDQLKDSGVTRFFITSRLQTTLSYLIETRLRHISMLK